METNNKLREALKAIRKEVYLYAIEEDKQDFAHLHEAMLDNPPEYKDLMNSFFAIAHLVDAALAEPVKNCEVGTLEEQAERFAEYCDSEVCKRNRCKFNAKALCIERCALAWAQMPYKEGGAK